MSQTDRLSQLLNAAADVASLLRRREAYHFQARPDAAFYLDAAGAFVRIFRHEHARIEVTAHLQAPFAWRIATDQDDAGVYMVAHRHGLIGAAAALTPLTSEAVFDVIVPRAAPLILRLTRCTLTLEGTTNAFTVPGETVMPLIAQPAQAAQPALPAPTDAPAPAKRRKGAR
jgi:hypothetical protein